MSARAALVLLVVSVVGGSGCDSRSVRDGADGRVTRDGTLVFDGQPASDGQPSSEVGPFDGPVATGPCPLAIPPANSTCEKEGMICECTNCIKYPVEICQGPLTWHCEAPNTTPGCPEARPNLGTPCSPEGKFCEYGCEHDASRRCESGIWEPASAPGGCPISTRAAKKEIRYLSPEELARVAVEARALRLATYRYRDPALDRREHLGFILEDSPTVPAADLEQRQVDLYSFTSMVLALSQQQQREIAALRRQVEALRRRLGNISTPRH